MHRLILPCLLATLVASCSKEEAEPPKYVGVSVPVFPLKKGNVWQYQTTNYYLDGTVANQTTVTDTIGISKMIDGIEFFEFGGSYYHSVDKVTFEIEGDRSGKGYEQKYTYYRYADGIDTLWKTASSGSAGYGDTVYCIAYPYDTVMNGYKCRRTEMRGYVYHDLLPYVAMKRVTYSAPGKGPVRELFFEHNGSQLYKTKEISYTPLLVSFD